MCRLVVGGPTLQDGGARKRLVLNKSLLTALVDRWRPETHTFHLPCGEMAPILQDVSFLLGLPLVGEAVGPRVIPHTRMDDLEARFVGVEREAGLGAIKPHPPSARGPAKSWLLQFQVHEMQNIFDLLMYGFGNFVMFLFILVTGTDVGRRC